MKDGEWTYEVKDGTVTITTAPAANKGAVGKTYTAEKDKDSPVFKKIADHINKSPELAERAQARKALEAQPAGVRRLFTGVFDLADKGEYDEAKKAANDVSSDDVRFAYGEALQEDPGAAANGIRALPEDVLGTAGESVLRALDAPSKTPIDVAAIQGNLRGLGGALLVAQDPERVARKKAQAEQDRAGTYEMRTGGRSESYQKGQEAGAKMVADTRSGGEAPPQPLVAQDGGWTYQMNRDGSVTVLETPANGEESKGQTFTAADQGADGKDYKAIVDLFTFDKEEAERVRAFKEWKPKPPASLEALLDTFDPKRSEYEAGVHAALTSALGGESTTMDDPAGRLVKESQYSRGLPAARVDPAPPQEGKPKSRMASADAPLALGWATDMNVVPGDDAPQEDTTSPSYLTARLRTPRGGTTEALQETGHVGFLEGELANEALQETGHVGFLEGELAKLDAQPDTEKTKDWWKDRRLALSREANRARAAAGGTSVDTNVTTLLNQLDEHEQIPEAERDPRWWGKTKDALRTRLEKEQDLAQKKRGSLPPPAPDEFDDFDAFMETDLGGSK